MIITDTNQKVRKIQLSVDFGPLSLGVERRGSGGATVYVSVSATRGSTPHNVSLIPSENPSISLSIHISLYHRGSHTTQHFLHRLLIIQVFVLTESNLLTLMNSFYLKRVLSCPVTDLWLVL